MKILKFGGKSLAPGKPLNGAIEIIKKAKSDSEIVVVVSALADSTDRLLDIYTKSINKESVKQEIDAFWEIQFSACKTINLDEFVNELNSTVGYLQIGNSSNDIKNQILSIGERVSAKIIAERLSLVNSDAQDIDARLLLKCNNGEIDKQFSLTQTKSFFDKFDLKTILVITGFIAEDEHGNITTLGRNGTNLTATLVANFLDADEVQNWTNIDGIYSANPSYVKNASKIDVLSFKEAHELANFGANVLHPSTINPLIEKEIPLRILNSFAPEKKGTLISKEGTGQGIKAVSVIENVALITIEGRGLSGKIGIDSRIFNTLERLNISVRLISQASSERGIGFVINKSDTSIAINSLNKEFENDINQGVISKINSNTETAIIAIVGRHNYSLEKAIQGLRRNKIWMHLISNSITGEHISLVIDNKNLKKAVNVVYNQVFGVIKTINLFAFGKGTVGGKFIDQIVTTSDEVVNRRVLRIRLVGIADSQKSIINENGIGENWRDLLSNSNANSNIENIIKELRNTGLENIVIADNTTSQEVTDNYVAFLKAGFDLVASNKKANSGSSDYYEEIRTTLKAKGRLFFYETNVGAGLPIIDTLKHLYDSADIVTKVRGVFSGSLSYIFNNYSERNDDFYSILMEAKNSGYTEPDPREDLNGLDVARKLIILAREVGLNVDLEQIEIENLIPENLQSIVGVDEFISKENELNSYYGDLKAALSTDEVLRYVGDLDAVENTLKVSLQKFPKSSPMGGIKNADAIFEIFTQGYGEQPIVVQGAGAGGEVTARGVYSDIVRIGKII